MARIDPDIESRFPNLSPNEYEKTSEYDPFYNCVAWAAGDTQQRWDPTVANAYWPQNLSRDTSIATFKALYEQELRFEPCDTGAFEEGFEKIALYGQPPDSFCHVARQLPDGGWSSKLGYAEDIRHDRLDSLESPDYGQVVAYLRRKRAK